MADEFGLKANSSMAVPFPLHYRFIHGKGETLMTWEKILIVDDDKDLLRGLSLRLKACDYHIAFASDVPSALGMARKERPDVIILDIGLPGGDGFMLMDRLKTLDPVSWIPIIILTARDPSTNRERAFKAGAQAFFQKPADNNELLAAIRKALGDSPDRMQGKI